MVTGRLALLPLALVACSSPPLATTSGTGGADGGVSGDRPWSLAFGGAGLTTVVDGIAVSGDDSVAVVGFALQADQTATGAHLDRYDPAGKLVWSLHEQTVLRAAFDADGSLIVAGTVDAAELFGVPVSCGVPTCAFVARLDTAGQVVWQKTYVPNGTFASAQVAGVAKDGRIAVAGLFNGILDLGAGPLQAGPEPQIFVAELSAAGDTLWSRLIATGTPGLKLWGASVDEAGDVLVSGTTRGAIDLGAGIEPVMTSPPLGVSGFVARFDPSGNLGFHRVIGSSTATNVTYLSSALAPAGDILLAAAIGGSFDLGGGPMGAPSGLDVTVARLDPTGKLLFGVDLGGATIAESPGPFGVAGDAGGRVWVSGFTLPGMSFAGKPVVSAGGADALLLTFDASGQPLTRKQFGAAGDQRAALLAIGPAGVPVIAGVFAGTIDFGQGSLGQVGTLDAFVAKLGP